jgi:outer membrane receptor protein involved in Fe transport
MWLLVACLVSQTEAFAQGNPTGTISGRITDQQGGVLPGVTVTATSPQLQGARTVVTSENGDYILPFLPPGAYSVVVELSGFDTVTRPVDVASAQTVPTDVVLKLAGLTETVTVTAAASAVVPRTTTAAATLKQNVVDQLPLNRGLDATVALAPGVQRTGIYSRSSGLGVISIGGATSFENLFLMNGVVLNENLRGQAIPLYIEDAIQETTVSTSGVSAEFGRFSGGVVNAITKSGGNLFGGSFRSTFENDDWRTTTPMHETKTDKLIPTYEYTFGGPILKDRIWFFNAGRFVEETRALQTTFSNLSWNRTRNEKRYEGKLSYAVDMRHTVRGAYLHRGTVTEGDAFSANILDLASLTTRHDPETLLSLNYNGILGSNFFIEGQYSGRQGSATGAGSMYTDMVRGTLLIDTQRGMARYNSPTFCGVCRTEERDNANILAKGSWFLSTPSWGSHNVVFGYDTFNDMRASDNHQSGSDWRIFGTTAILRDGDVFPVFNDDGRSTVIQWNPILVATQGTNFRMHSVFLNDGWRWTDRLSFNLGARFDRNHAVDSAGTVVADDQKISPRLGVTWDPTGGGQWTVNGSYGVYVASISNAIANGASIAGNPSTLQYAYTGPAINIDPNAPLVTREQAILTVFDWFNANGGTMRPLLGVNLPGVNMNVADTLVSPSADEYAGGVTRTLGQRGMVRVDGVYRNFNDFYGWRTDMSTGRLQVDPITLQATTTGGRPLDVRLIETTNMVDRQYAALNSMFSWRIGERVNLNAAYTLSHLWGNFDGENEGAGPAAVTPAMYPEYREERWNYPTGDLLADQRHKGRVWGTWQLPTPEGFGGLYVGALFNVDSGAPYGAVGVIDPTAYRTGLGYVTPPTQVQYYFTDRAAFRTEASTRTDLAINYDYRFGGVRRVTVFVKGEVLNVFDQSKLVNPFFIDQTVLTASNAPTRFQRFDPFTATPVQGTNWDFGPNFGNATNRFAYQLPRTLRFAVGVRF